MITLHLNELYNTLFEVYMVGCLNINNLLITPTIIYFFAYFGLIFNARNLLSTMICMELIYLATITSVITIANSIIDAIGHIFALYLVAIAATESAIGLCLLTVLFK